MNHVQLNFDAATVAPSEGRSTDPCPKGRYKVAIDECNYGPVASNPGAEKLELQMVVLDGQFKGRKFFTLLNLRNPSAMAQQIAWETLSAIQRAAGVMKSGTSADLLGRPFEVDVSIEQSEPERDPITQAIIKEYPARNRIDKYYSLSGIPLAQIGTAGGGAPAFVPPGPAAPAPGLPVPGQTQAPPPAPQRYMMTAKAGQFTLEQMITGGWTIEALVAQGYAEPARAAAPPPPPAPPSVPAPPTAGGMPPGYVPPPAPFTPTAPGMGGSAQMPPPAPGGAAGDVPLWMRGLPTA